MQEQVQAAQLKRMRLWATGLLVLMAVAFIVARNLESAYPELSFVSAFAEAAMVGGLADWFAVSALFRSPFGLPIPHTAIIPKSKDRIGNALANFIQTNFLTREIIRDEMRRVDFAEALASWLSIQENSRVVSRQILRAIPLVFEFVDDEEMHKTLLRHAEAVMRNIRLAPVLAEVVDALSAKGYHQELFTHLVGMATDVFEHNKPYIRWKIHESSPRWMPKAVDEKFYVRILQAIRSTLDEMREDDSEWRLRFQRAVDHLIEHLRTSSTYEERLGVILSDVMQHPAFDAYAVRFLRDIKGRVAADALVEDSLMLPKLEEIFASLRNRLRHDVQLRTTLNEWVSALITEVVVARSKFIAGLIARVIHKWDAETMSNRLELQVGRDLQYIRINGTLVGGVVGVILHAISITLR